MPSRKYWNHGSTKSSYSTRDFGGHKQGSPLFGGKKTTRSRAYGRSSGRLIIPWAIISYSLFFLVFLSGLGFVFWGNYFKINQIELSGSRSETEGAIREALGEYLTEKEMLVFPKSSYFMFSRAGSLEKISSVVYLESIEISKKFPNKIIVNVNERDEVGVFAGETGFFMIDAEGKAIRQLTEAEMIRIDDVPESLGSTQTQELGSESVAVTDLVTVSPEASEQGQKSAQPQPTLVHDVGLGLPLLTIESDESGRPIELAPGKEIVPSSAVTIIMTAYRDLVDVAGTGIRWFNVRPTADTVDVTMEGDWHIYLSTALPFEVQADRLALVLKEKIGDKKNLLQYIDLRFNERVFFRLSGSDSQ